VRCLTAALSVVVLGAFPAAAWAKGDDARAVRICGANRCVTLTDRTELEIVLSIGAYGTVAAPAEPAPYFTISTVPPGDVYRYVPSAASAREALADGGAWLAVPRFVSDLIYWQATRQLRPYPGDGEPNRSRTVLLAVAAVAAALAVSGALGVARAHRLKTLGDVERG